LLHNPSEAIIGCVDRIGAVDFDAFWYFIPTYDEAQILPTNSANAWYTTNYQVDANWAGGNAPFYFKSGCFSNCYGFFGTSGASTNCGALGSPVSIGYPTIAFRREFIVPSNSPAVGQLRFQHVTDDGAIFYLNGKELLRYNMTNVPVTFNYFAPCILNEPTCQTQAYTLNNLLVGTNVLCAEVHSCDEFDGADFMFGCQLDIIVTNYATQIPEIRVTRTPATNAVKRVFLDWDYPGWQLQTSTNLANTNLGATGWTNVMNGAVPYPTNLTRYTNNPTEVGRGRHYRLVWPRPR